MRKLILWNVVTLDGYFEGEKNWDLGFHGLVWGKELEDFSLSQLKGAEILVFGAITYKGMADYWTNAGEEEGEIATFMNSIHKIACSTTLKTASWNNTMIVKDAIPEISKLKEEGNGEMFVFGSGILSSVLLKADLFDEIRLCIAPVLLGSGRQLFHSGMPQKNLTLVETKSLSTGGLILRYSKI